MFNVVKKRLTSCPCHSNLPISIYMLSKQSFARKINRDAAALKMGLNGNNNTNNTTTGFTNNNAKKSIFSKFSKFSPPPENNTDSSSNHFKRVLKKETLGVGLDDDTLFNSGMIDRKSMRQMEEKLMKGKSVKEVVREMMAEKEEKPKVFKSKLDVVDEEESEMREKMMQSEIEIIKKSMEEKREGKKKTKIDPEQINIYDITPRNEEIGSQNNQNRRNIYSSQEELDLFKSMLKTRNKMKSKEEDMEEVKNFKVRSVKDKEDDNEEESNSNISTLNKKSSPEEEKLKKEFEDLFDRGKKKTKQKKKRGKSANNIDNEERDLRKIKNITNPEYSLSQSEHDLTAVDIVDRNIPDLNIAEMREKSAETDDKLRELVLKDLHPFDAKVERKDALIHDMKKLSKINTLNIVDLRKNKNEIFKKRALDLAKIWYMDARETKQWYYRLRREEKLIVKAILMKKKLEQKRKLKKLAQQWKIDNEENIDINYLQTVREAANTPADKAELNNDEKDNLKIPEHYKNIDEFIFFGEDTEFFRHYKRTCRNIFNYLNELLSSNKQGIKKGLSKNTDIVVNEVKMNKACTVLYIWWDLPLNHGVVLVNTSKDERELLFKTVEINLHKAIPYIKGAITRRIGLKYAPQIRFIRDTIDEELDTFEQEITKFKERNDEFKIKKESEAEINLIASIFDRPAFVESFRNMVQGISDPKEKENLMNIYFTDQSGNAITSNSDVKISHKLQLLNEQSPDVLHNLINNIKKVLGNKTFNELKQAEIEAMQAGVNNPNITGNNQTDQQVGKKSKIEKRLEKQKEKVLKKLNMKEEDLKMSKDVNISNSINNFLHQYERKIPGQFTFNPSLKELKERKNKKDFIDEIIEEKVNKKIKSIVKESAKIGKSKESKREKAAEFWKNLDNLNY